MTIISSQHYIDWTIVNGKIEQIKDMDKIIIPCWYVGEIDGVEYAMQADAHHTLAAARELDIDVEFDITDDPEGLTGDDMLMTRWMDGDYYNVETSNPAYGQLDIIW